MSLQPELCKPWYVETYNIQFFLSVKRYKVECEWKELPWTPPIHQSAVSAYSVAVVSTTHTFALGGRISTISSKHATDQINGILCKTSYCTPRQGTGKVRNMLKFWCFKTVVVNQMTTVCTFFLKSIEFSARIVTWNDNNYFPRT
jgi:hypothetical protein